MRITLGDVQRAEKTVREHAWRTPVVPAPGLEGVHLKLESLQRLGSFKIRGVSNRVAVVGESARRGLVTVSAGNHGLAVAYIASRRQIPCRILVPRPAAPAKVAAIRALGAKVEEVAFEEAAPLLAGETRDVAGEFVHPFAHAETIAGAGTVGLEIARDVPDVETVLVPVGGGGLAAGVLAALRGLRPRARVLGVQAEAVAPLAPSLVAGGPAEAAPQPTIADGIRIPRIFPAMWPLLQHLDGVLTVPEPAIRDAIGRLARDARVVAEGAGAVAYAAARLHPELSGPVVAIVSGGNVEPALLADCLQGA